MSARQDLLRAYIGALAAEGVFAGANTFTIARRVWGAFAADLATLGGELAEFAAKRGVQVGSDVVFGKVGDFVKNIAARGLTSAFEEAFAAYWRGAGAAQDE